MQEEVPFAAVPAGLGRALEAKGFTELTAVQKAVLDPDLAGRDLRMSSQTGSGKTVAIGLVLASALEGIDTRPPRAPAAKPRIVVIAPTRELAAQIGGELAWLYRPLRARVVVVTGGTPMGRDFRALGDQPHVLVGTPGRLVDHLERGSLVLSEVRAVVLDEADEMLDMGFRDDLGRILDDTPSERSTHLVSATLPREVLRLADTYQRDPVVVQGSPGGKAHADIEHVGHMVHAGERFNALVNLLLADPDGRTLVFVRTRATTSELAAALVSAGFSAGPMSGEMGQRERNAMVEALRSGAVRIVVATDVAARGLDINDVTQVIHFDLPENPEVLTHRSGRTGRAGNKGTSIALVPRGARRRFESHLRSAGIRLTWSPVPSPASIRAAADARLLAELSAVEPTGDERWTELAQNLLETVDPIDLVATLLARSSHAGPCEPRPVAEVKQSQREKGPPPRAGKGGAPPRRRDSRDRSKVEYTPFHVSWGASAGANPSRLLAMVCRRGQVRSDHIGAIRILPHRSVVEVASHLADDFARATRQPDARNPRVKIRPWDPAAGGGR